MNRVCCIIDMEGFQLVGRRFLVRELGFIGVNSHSADSIAFDLSPYEKLLNNHDRKTMDYVTKNISGLPFHPSVGEETVPLTLLSSKVTAIHHLYRNQNKDLLAFKGGNIERNFLRRLNIPYLDLQDYGCPKFDELKKDRIFKTCGYHTDETLHCPQAEVTALGLGCWKIFHRNARCGSFIARITQQIRPGNTTVFQNTVKFCMPKLNSYLCNTVGLNLTLNLIFCHWHFTFEICI